MEMTVANRTELDSSTYRYSLPNQFTNVTLSFSESDEEKILRKWLLRILARDEFSVWFCYLAIVRRGRGAQGYELLRQFNTPSHGNP